MKKLKLLLLLSFLTTSMLFGQNDPCGTDILHNQKLQDDPEYKEAFLARQKRIKNYIKKIKSDTKKNYQRAANEEVIPVVFHVIHLGESIGSGSNISDAEIMESFDQLNEDFANLQGDGVDMSIQFCLAERDPEGMSTNGIIRVDGSVNSSYASMGISSGSGGNEVAVKALSIWPNTDYVNIWVVHNISGSAIGYAHFPGAAANVDGVVLDDFTFTSSSYEHVITHELGHFFDLYHTFTDSSDGDPSTCPPNSPSTCDIEGDFCCDTRPHTTTFPSTFCNENEFYECDSGPYTFAVHKNYMNYIDNSCMSIFTSDQVDRANAALNTTRYSLTQSLGCQPPCPGINVDFTISDNTVNSPITIDFTNTSTGGVNPIWTVDGNTYTSEDLSYTFTDPGIYYVCLSETSTSGCVDNNCQAVQILGPDPCVDGLDVCNLVLNGNFEQVNIPLDDNCHGNTCYTLVCNWENYPTSNTPFFCNNNSFDNNATLASWAEGISTEDELALVDGETYTLSFEYLHRTNENPPTDYQSIFKFGLVDSDEGSSTEVILGQLNNPSIDIFNSVYTTCDHQDQIFNSFSTNFTYSSSMPLNLFFQFNEIESSTTDDSYISFKKVIISDCATCIPDVEITATEDCPYEFTAQNTGDGDTYFWEFCDGTTLTGQTVSYNPPAGECQVCVTVYCSPDEEFGTTFCENMVFEDCDSYTCEIIDDYGQDNRRKNSGKDILALKKTYSFVGNIMHQVNTDDDDHYIVTRDYDNVLQTNARIGDFDNIESDIEQSTAITNFGKYKYVTGYTDIKDRDKDIYVAKLDENNNIIWCKIYDYGRWDQEGTGIQVVKPALGSLIPRIFVTGFTLTQGGTTDMFLLQLSDNPATSNSGGQISNFRIYGTTNRSERAYDLLTVGKSLLIVGEHSGQHATVLKVNFNGIIQEQFSLSTYRTKYNSVSTDGSIGVAVGKQGSDILMTGFRLTDLSIVFNRTLSSHALRTEEAMDIIFRKSVFYTVGRSTIRVADEDKDDGFFFTFRLSNNIPFLINEQITDLPVKYSESFNAIDRLGSADLVMIGDFHEDDKFNDIFFVKTNEKGENCCMKDVTFKMKNGSKSNFDCCVSQYRNLDSNRYGRREYSYRVEGICEGKGAPAFSESNAFENRSTLPNRQLRVSPNPTNGFFTLEFDSGETGIQISKTSILDISGKEVFSRVGDNPSATIDLTKFDNGIYIVHCILDDGSTMAEKIILVR